MEYEEIVRSYNHRKAIWDRGWLLHHQAYCRLALLGALQSRWKILDLGARFLTATVAGGSAIAAWSIWSSITGRVIWSVLAGIATVYAGVHTALKTPSRLISIEQGLKHFSPLTIDIDDFCRRVFLDESRAAAELEVEFQELLERYKTGDAMLGHDYFESEKLKRWAEDRMIEKRNELEDVNEYARS